MSNEKEERIEENLEELNYPANEDIFIKEEHVSLDVNGNVIGEGMQSDTMEMDLDVPGSDLDNAQEKIGSEDEENNYYSIGGDNHNDLEQSDDN